MTLTPDRRSPKVLWVLFPAAVVCCAVLGVVCFRLLSAPSATTLLNQARRFRAARKFELAEQAARAALKADPKLSEAAWLATEAASLQGEFARAIESAHLMPDEPSPWRIKACLMSADLNFNQLYHLQAAEDDYRAVLNLDRINLEANAGLAKLLGLCGRQRQAAYFVLTQIQQRNPTDQLMLLAREGSGINDPETLKRAHAAFPDDPDAIIGLARLELDAGRFEAAIQLLRPINEVEVHDLAAYLSLGEVLLAAEKYQELTDWLKRWPEGLNAFQVYYIRGRLAELTGNVKGAIRCYWEATRMFPESKACCQRLSRLLAEAGDQNASSVLAEHLKGMQELITAQDRALFSNDAGSLKPMLQLTHSYEKIGRLWEAYGWCLLLAGKEPPNSDINARLAELQRKVKEIPLKMTVDSANPANLIDLSLYPLPGPPKLADIPEERTAPNASSITFEENSGAVGLQFHYFNGTDGPPTRRMFEFTGGGIGVIDFDLDDWPDVAFTQGCTWPPGSTDNTHGDRLFRNHLGERFIDVSANAGLHEKGFGQGISVGDYNSDGFPDLYAANIGTNALWQNNGDGTFTNVTAEAGISGEAWTTSCVLADFSGDGLPDIYDVNYVTGQDVYDRVCRHQDGSPKICMPFDFDGQPDRLWLNDGNGRFTDVTKQVFSEPPIGKGLGVAVWNAQGNGRLSLLVANDTTPDFFFERDSAGTESFRLIDHALPAGLAFNADGKATASMGVALDDVNEDGQLDVHITNFTGESNSLFVSVSPGVYEDRSREWGLHGPTVDLLGFGTQFLDADLDGRAELFITNGHIDDWRAQGRQYEMPPLLLRRQGSRFEPLDPQQVGAYFSKHWLGRSVARFDWNRDAREDLIVGHLAVNSALLTNTTETRNGCVAIRLIGVKSNRDAIGAIIRATIGKRSVTRQITAGDGYQASNERRIVIGLGSALHIDELQIEWPSGAKQVFTNVLANQNILLIEEKTLITSSIAPR